MRHRKVILTHPNMENWVEILPECVVYKKFVTRNFPMWCYIIDKRFIANDSLLTAMLELHSKIAIDGPYDGLAFERNIMQHLKMMNITLVHFTCVDEPGIMGIAFYHDATHTDNIMCLIYYSLNGSEVYTPTACQHFSEHAISVTFMRPFKFTPIEDEYADL